MEPPAEPFRLRFNPTIDLGSIATAVIMLGAVLGWGIIGYETINKQLDAQATETQLLKQRLTADELDMKRQSEDYRASTIEIRSALGKLLDQIGDLRALVAAQGARDGPHH